MSNKPEPLPIWRMMAPADLPAVHALSMRVHPDYPERAEVLAEKLALFPSGCFALAGAKGIAGYCFTHPWTRGAVPALDTLIGALPERPDTYFIHDLTIDASLRGSGLGRAVVPLLFNAARTAAMSRLTLVAVNDRWPFWQAAGFVRVTDPAMQEMVRGKYGPHAVLMEREIGRA
jgi:GNAT superfamily N-acetyltransferase